MASTTPAAAVDGDGGHAAESDLQDGVEEWEVEEENQTNDNEDHAEDDGHQEETEEMEDEHALVQTEMKNGKQCGFLRQAMSGEFIEQILKNIDSVGSLPDGILKQLRRAMVSKLPGLRAFANTVVRKLKLQKVTWMPGKPPAWWKTLWSMVRNRVRRASKSKGWKLKEHHDVIELMQRNLDVRPAQVPQELAFQPEDRYRFARTLQRDMLLQTQLHGSVSAGAMQLDSWLMGLLDVQPPCVLDVVQMCSAVVVAVGNVEGQLPDIGEERSDAIDIWVAGWQRRIMAWLRMLSVVAEPVVVVEDSEVGS